MIIRTLVVFTNVLFLSLNTYQVIKLRCILMFFISYNKHYCFYGIIRIRSIIYRIFWPFLIRYCMNMYLSVLIYKMHNVNEIRHINM